MMLCFFHRRKLSARVDADLGLEPALQHHINQCAACRAFYERELSVARGLARGAAAVRVAAPPFLEARIMAAVERSGRPARSRTPVRRLVWTAGLAAAIVLGFRAFHGPLAPPTRPATPDLSSVIQELAALEKSLPNDQKLAQLSATMDAPLKQELRSLVHDARGAAQMLVLNFLPDKPPQSPEGDQDGK